MNEAFNKTRGGLQLKTTRKLESINYLADGREIHSVNFLAVAWSIKSKTERGGPYLGLYWWLGTSDKDGVQDADRDHWVLWVKIVISQPR
jgi:hypothetical protein